RQRHRAALAEQAYRDPLTGLANRATLVGALDPGTGGVLLLIDLDGFKAVNDTLGHGAGDQLLTVVGERIRAVAPRSALAARLGGDEFAVLLPAATAGRRRWRSPSGYWRRCPARSSWTVPT